MTEINFKREWCGCDLKEGTNDPECTHYELDCKDCPVYIKSEEEWARDKAFWDEEVKKRYPNASIINKEGG